MASCRPAPARLIEDGLPTEATIAQVQASKYADHLPLYRQSYLSSPVSDLRPIHVPADCRTCCLASGGHRTNVARQARASVQPFADETTLPVLIPVAVALRPVSCGPMPPKRPWGGPDLPGRLCLRPGPQVRAADHPSPRLQKYFARMALLATADWPQGVTCSCILLGLCGTPLQARPRPASADCERSAQRIVAHAIEDIQAAALTNAAWRGSRKLCL